MCISWRTHHCTSYMPQTYARIVSPCMILEPLNGSCSTLILKCCRISWISGGRLRTSSPTHNDTKSLQTVRVTDT
ncbi:hypothetical protein Bca4012_070783 [Brassica carinata]